MENDIEVSSCDAIIVTGTPLVSILDDTAAGEWCYLLKDIEISNLEDGRALNSWWLIGLWF